MPHSVLRDAIFLVTYCMKVNHHILQVFTTDTWTAWTGTALLSFLSSFGECYIL